MAETTKVRLELHAQQLKNVAGTFKGKSDPFAIVTLLANDPKEKPRVLGKTEVIKNSLSPRWTAHFDLDYVLSRNTRINVGVWDEVRKGTNKAMGSALFEIGDVLGARGNTKAKKLRNGGTLFARVTPVPVESAGILHLNLRGIKLKNVEGVFGKSDPFFEISARTDSAGGLTWQPVYRSKPIMNNLNPNWPAVSLDLGRLCRGDFNKPIMISIWDWQKNGKHTAMGKFETSVNGLIAAQVFSGETGPSKSVSTKSAFTPKRSGKELGKIVVTSAKLEGHGGSPKETAPPAAATAPAFTSSPPIDAPAFSQALNLPPPSLQSTATAVSAAAAMSKLNLSTPTAPPVPYTPVAASSSAYAGIAPMAPPVSRPTFVDYVTGGCELELSIAIDFTGSNGDPRKPGTLHYRHPDGHLNDYEKAITAVGAVIARYDSDQKFPVFGFGAKYGGVIRHSFQVGNKSELDGIAGVLEGYRNVFRSGLTMSGPTVFDEVINYAAATARSKQEASQRTGQQSYKILLILTDGAVTDMERTKKAIKAAGDAPLSIVIVGIGNADFSAMQELDDFVSNGNGTRDIVQFVEFSQHQHNRAALTRETLDEIPDQLVDYFFNRGIKPLPPISGSQFSLHAEDPNDEDIDLSMDISPEGEISLANYNGAVYDDTQYATISDYTNVQPMPAPFAPGASAAPYQPSAPAPYSVPPEQARPQAFNNSVPVAQSVQPAVFHVQVPQNVTPGMQLRIQHPATKQSMIVTVPNGVAPGGKFAVPY